MNELSSTAATNGRLWGSAARDWADIQERACRPVYITAFERLSVGVATNYLDLGCGSGMAAEIAAKRGARVSGLDAAENLLAIAKTRVPSGYFDVGRLEELPYADDSFDVVTGFNSFQYAAKPIEALMQAKRVTRPAGKVLIMTWGRPEGMEAASLLAALKPLLPPLPPETPGPFALSDHGALRDFAIRAFLEPMDFFDVESPWVYSSLEEALRGLRSSGVAARAIEFSSADLVDSAHTAALVPFRQPDGRYRIRANFCCLVARA